MVTALVQKDKAEITNKKVDLIVTCLVRKQIISSWELEKIDELSEMRTTEIPDPLVVQEKKK